VAVEIEAEIAKEIAEESGEKKRQAALERESEKRGECIQKQTKAKVPNSGRAARKEAATLTGGKTGERQITDAKKLKQQAPDLFKQVKDGDKTIGKAKREHKKRTFIPPPPVQGKYRVFYADPPWQYGNEFSGGDEVFQAKWTAAETHYPTMSIEELCEMGGDIKQASEENAVLFLWTTEPIRDEAIEVVEAWGFKRKSAFIWDKTRDTFGNYNSVQHEHLLICTRGSCLPDAKEKIRSIVAEPKTPKHSEKPERFREIIDTLYTWGNRIEFFARGGVPEQWESWGNEINNSSTQSDNAAR
jgi:N6-adenosine-specific RNA methylase IME4